MAENDNKNEVFDLEKLRKDPDLWKRLSMPKGEADTLENIFEGDENPFIKDGPAAMERLRQLAEAGNLYVREYGRATHYQKIGKEGDVLKPEGQYVLKRGATWDPIGNVLLRASSAYFKWLGLDSIGNWFEKRLKARYDEAEKKNQERDKYKQLSRKEKKELKKLQKKEAEIEKARKKLEKLEKETEEARKEWNKLMGNEPGKDKGIQQPQQNQPPQVNQPQQNQPPQVNQQPLVNQQPTPPVNQTPTSQRSNLVQQSVFQQEFLGNQMTGKTEVKDNSDDIPEYVKNAARIVENYMKERLVSNDPNKPDLIIEEAYQLPVKETKEQTVQAPVEEITNTVENQNPEPVRQDSEPPKTDMDSPINNPPDLEKGKIDALKRSKDQADLYDRLTAEKQAMDAVKNWQDRVVDSLFSHEEGQTMKEYYDMIKGNKEAGDEFLAGAVCGMLSKNATGPERNQQVMDDLLDGKSLGSQNENLISDGIAAYNNAIEKKTNGNSKPLEELLANSIRDLSRQASRETTLSPRLVMIGRMISNAVKIADDNALRLPLDKEDWSIARGAATLATLSQKYHSARQYLGQEPMDISSSKGRRAVGDLLAGSAVEKMLQQDKRRGQTITNTQMIMGEGMWTMDNLRVFTKDSPTRRGITQEQVQTLMEKPNGLKALGIAKNVADDIVFASMEVQEEIEKAKQKELEVDQEKEPEINPIQTML